MGAAGKLNAGEYFEHRKKKVIEAEKIKVYSSQLVSGGYLSRTYMIKKYPSVAMPGILYRLNQLKELKQFKKATIRVAERFVPGEVKWDWRMKMKFARLESTIKEQKGKPGGIVDKEIESAYYSLLHLKDKDQNEGSKVFDVWIFITVTAPSETIIKRLEKQLKHELDNIDIKLERFRDEQDMAMKSTLATSLPVDEFYKKYTGRLMDDDAASMFYPLTDGTFSDGFGTYFGHRTADYTPIYINLEKDENNKNIMVVGASGEGKSTLLKALVISLLMQGYRIFVFDVDGEYYKLCQHVKGLWIDHTLDSGKYVDPVRILDPIGNNKLDKSRYQDAASRMKRVVALLGGTLEDKELNAADRALMKTWKDAEVNKKDQSTWCTEKAKKEATIHKWYKNLQEDENEAAKSLVEKVWTYFEGTMSDMFANEDNLESIHDQRLTVVHVAKEIDNQEEQRIGAVKMTMAQDTIWSEVKREKEKGEKFCAIVIDEGQRTLENEMMSSYVYTVGTTIRKYDGLLVLATNHPGAIWKTKGGEALWGNSAIKISFWMEPGPLEELKTKSDFPKDIIDELMNFYQTRKFIIRYKDPARQGKEFDIAKLILSSEEQELYRTRRTS